VGGIVVGQAGKKKEQQVTRSTPEDQLSLAIEKIIRDAETAINQQPLEIRDQLKTYFLNR
jgi:hypothetical protein